MRSALRYCAFILLFLGTAMVAQGDEIDAKLQALKTQNDLSNWIYERLDYVNENADQRLSFLMASQKDIWRKPKTADEQYAWLHMLSTQGYYQLLNGNILGSINSYENALGFYLEHHIDTYDIVEYILKPLSNNYTRLGDYERALYLQQRSIKFQSLIDKNPEKIAAIYCNMAISYRAMGRLDDATLTLKKGLSLTQPNTTLTIMLTNVHADILYDQGHYATAAALIENNIKKQKLLNTESAYWLMGSYTTAGNVYLELQELRKAAQYYHRAIAILDKYYLGTRIRERASLYTQIGKTALQLNQPQVALQFFKETLSTLKISDGKGQVMANKIYGDNKLVEVFEQMASVHLLLKNPREALVNIKFSLLAANKIRSEFADDKTKERLQRYLKLIAEKGIEISYQQYQQAKDKKLLSEILEFAEQTKSRTLLDQINSNKQHSSILAKDSLFIRKLTLERAIIYQEKQEIESKSPTSTSSIAALKYNLSFINKQIKQKYGHIDPEDYSLNLNTTKLPKGRTIEYFFGKHALYLIDIDQGRPNHMVKIENAALVKSEIQHYVNTYFQDGPAAMLNAPKAFYQSSFHLYQTLLGKITFAPNEHITIIPDEVLGYISFDGLMTKDHFTPNISSWPFFIKQHTISYAFSLKTLALNQTKNSKGSFTGFFITHQKGHNKPLKAIADEAKGIQQLVSGNFIFNERVNASSFMNAFENSKVLHIGTHAYLSGLNKEPTLDLGSEKVYLFEFADQQHAPDLVVLSACRTADGLLANGEGIISLSRGFNAIGTSSTIAGLWNVNDRAASLITHTLYQNLKAGETGSEALRKAKLAWLTTEKPNDGLYLPYYWDSLIYMGRDQSFELRSPVHNLLIWGMGLALILATLPLVAMFIKYIKRKAN
ncbi:CHAT domain-containing protein [Pedobacter sp. ASV28]|uniref:CHAT domain-containing protein n=1 Tax=Pedobacter sp. ASV28 TaxID=2795123 RepID=UPI0018EB66A4|nr:CHAT domain-containing protein [Pedobacter sp. ASV28]